MEKQEIVGYEPFINELKELIQKKQYRVLQTVNAETINLYWEIGEEIYKQQKENGWGKSIVQVLSKELQKEFPGAKGYSAANLWRMRNFYLTYRDSEKLAPLVREINWSNNIIIMACLNISCMKLYLCLKAWPPRRNQSRSSLNCRCI